MQLEIAGGTGRRIRDDRGELPSVWIGCTPLELLAKPVEIYDRGEHSESPGGKGGGGKGRFIGVGL